jgi:hypothetical protein
MQWIIFGILTTLVAVGVNRVMRDTQEFLRGGFDPTKMGGYQTRTAAQKRPAAERPDPRHIAAQDTVQCPTCGAYVVKGQPCCDIKGDA